MKNRLALAIVFGMALQAHGQITQTATAPGGVDWNSASLWSNAQAPLSTDTYSTATGLAGSGGPDVSQPGGLSSTAYTDTLRGLGSTFGGASLTIVGNTRLLIKSTGTNFTSTGNIILGNNGNIVNGDGGNADTLAGSLQVGNSATDSGFLFSNNTGNGIFTVSSNITGLGILNVGAEQYTGFLSGVALTGSDNSFGGTLNYFTPGTFSISGLVDSSAAMDFSTTTLGSAVSSFSSANNLTVGGLMLGSTSVASGTYTGAQLDVLGGTTIFSTDADTITVVPEPNIAMLLFGGIATLFGITRFLRPASSFLS